MVQLFKKYGWLLHILVASFAVFYRLTDMDLKLFVSSGSMSLFSEPWQPFLGIIYGTVGLCSLRDSRDKSKSYKPGFLYLTVGIVIFACGP